MSTQHPNPNGQTSVSGGRGLPPTSIVNAAGSGDEYVVCWIQIPLLLNDGSDVDPEIMSALKEVLARWFGGLTVLGECQGHWNGGSEPSIRIEVALPRKRVGELKDFVRAFRRRLGQDAMYLVELSASAYFLEADGEE